MNEIIFKKQIAYGIKLMKLKVPFIAKSYKPGQFIIVRVHEKGERIPLTIVEAEKESETITIIFQEVGKTTKMLGELEEGDKILDVVGPLGKPSEIKLYGNVAVVGGGVATAVVYPVAKALKDIGNKIISITGARNKELLILENEMKEISDEYYISTDDGSKGYRGFVSDVLKELLYKKAKIDMVFTAGPVIMMKAIADITRPYGIKTIASLNPIMIDGTGMCGVCRVLVNNEIKFACVDGPEFDAHLVDFDLLIKRQSMYLKEEEISLKHYKRGFL
ncbi:MAG: sulfide/dihydroorotate dehydrogenase-like FAD/NAD-binding protein [Candidatus Bathyarchaeia archaeon]